MTSTIRQTVELPVSPAYRDQYSDIITEVVDRLVAREADLAALCISYAEDQGADGETTRRFLESIGMSVPTPPAEDVGAAVNARLDAIAEQVAAIGAELNSLRSHR